MAVSFRTGSGRRRRRLGVTVFDAAVDRMVAVYEDGHRPVVSFSGGKDSACTLEVTIVAAKLTGNLPVDVVMRDEEIMYPGTFEYAERVAQRPEVSFNWLVAHQPIINAYNRESPYFWAFDPLLPPTSWVRTFPDRAIEIADKNIERMTTPERFPPAAGKQTMAVLGLRVQESRGRLFGLFSSGGYLTKPNRVGVPGCRPIYDWSDGDVWRAIRENKWDYAACYDTLHRLGVKRSALRLAPPTMHSGGATSLRLAAKAWPRWFDAVCQRLPGVRAVGLFGLRAVSPWRRSGETWQECFQRECIEEAPEWIAARARKFSAGMLSAHGKHATGPLPEIDPCYNCQGGIGAWRRLAFILWSGDPFSLKTDLPYVEPEFFRPGAGTWDGTPAFA